MLNLKHSILLKTVILVSIALLVTFIAYHKALQNSFVTWDTGAYLIDNPHIKALTWENLTWMWTAFHAANWHPLTWFSHALDYAIFGMTPRGHHLTNLILHSLNVVLFFGVALVLLTVSTTTAPFSFAWTKIEDKILLAAFVAALLFAIHPQHVESVAWLAERKDVLCLFFVLLAFWSYLFYALRSHLLWYIVALICFMLALLSKPMAVTLPVILLLMDIYPLRRTHLTTLARPVSYKILVLEKIPFFVLSMISAILTVLAQQSSQAVVSLQTMGIALRLLNACDSIILYISKFILPVSLSPLYLMYSSQSFHSPYASVLPVLGCGLITFVCSYLWYKKHYYWLITWLFYLITLLPVLGIIQVGSQAAADRYTYLPTLPFNLLVGMGVAGLFYHLALRNSLKVGLTIGLLVIVTQLVRLTQEQLWIWKNDVTLWTYAVIYDPDNPIAQMNLGVAYTQRGEYEQAIMHLKAAASMTRHKLIYLNLLEAFSKLNRFADALKVYELALKFKVDIDQSKEVIYYNMGNLHFQLEELEKAQEFLQKALVINPNYEPAKNLLAQVVAKLK